MAINYTLTPSPWQTFFYTTGAPVANGQLFTYLAGTTTPATTYLNSSGTPNTNPIILDAAGRAVIYLAGGSYRFDLYDSVVNGGALIKTEDNISAVPVSASQPSAAGVAGTTIVAGQAVYLSDGSGGLTAGRWYLAQANNAYSSTKPEIGFAQADTTAGNPIAVVQTGQVLSPLTVTNGTGLLHRSDICWSVNSYSPTLARYVGQADTVSSLIVGNAPPAQPLVLVSVAVGTQNDFNPGLSNFAGLTIVRMGNASLTTITGIAAGYDGQRILFQALGAARVDFASASSGSSAPNRLVNWVSSANTSIVPSGGVIEYVYDATNTFWRLVHHEQGSWIAPAFSSGNFIGGGSSTWTVIAGNVLQVAYRLSGKTLTVAINITGTSVGGTPSNALLILNGAWGGFVADGTGSQMIGNLSLILAPAGSPTGYTQVLAGVLSLLQASQANWAASANTTLIFGMATFEVL